MSIGALADELLEQVRAEEKTASAPANTSATAKPEPVPSTSTGEALRKVAQELRRIGESEKVTVSDLEAFIRSGK